MVAGEDVVFSQPLGRGVEQDLLQRAAMNRELRPVVPGLEAARLAPDRFAVLGKIREFFGAHARGVELVQQTQFDQLAHGMRQHVDADPERPQLRHAFEHARGNADLVQAERQGQPANAAAGDKYRHPKPLKSCPFASWHERPGRATASRRLAAGAIEFPSGLQHQLAQPDRAGIELGPRRIEHELLVDAGIERRRHRHQRERLGQSGDQPAAARRRRGRCAPRYAALRYSRAPPARCAARCPWLAASCRSDPRSGRGSPPPTWRAFRKASRRDSFAPTGWPRRTASASLSV